MTTLDTLWYTRCPVPTGLGIAVQQGWLEQAFAAQSTIIRSLRESTDQAVRESHFDHTLQNSVRHGGNIPALWAKADGRDTRVLGLSWADETQRILVLPDSDINTVRDLRGRRFGLPLWRNAQIDFSRAQALRGLENALRLDGLYVHDVTLFDYPIDSSQSEQRGDALGGAHVFSGGSARNPELLGLLRREVDAIFLKGAHAAQVAQQFGLRTIIDTGAHPDPLIRANNGTPRTLTVDANLLEQHFGAAVTIVEQVLRAEAWSHQHPDQTRRYLARETNSSEYFVASAYGEDAHLKLVTDLSDSSIAGLQDFADFLYRWHFLPAAVDVRSWIDARPLQAALAQLQRAA